MCKTMGLEGWEPSCAALGEPGSCDTRDEAAWSSREILPANFTSALKSSAFISGLLTFLGSMV